MSLSPLDEHAFVPEQLHPAPAAQPERLLVAAVLERAAWDLRSTNAKVREEAETWFMDDSSEPWSFVWIATVLDLDLDHLRRSCLPFRKSRDTRDSRDNPYAATASGGTTSGLSRLLHRDDTVTQLDRGGIIRGVTLEDYIAAVRRGLQVPGNPDPDNEEALVTGLVTLDPTDVDAVTAEAFALDVFDVDRITWDEAREVIARAVVTR